MKPIKLKLGGGGGGFEGNENVLMGSSSLSSFPLPGSTSFMSLHSSSDAINLASSDIHTLIKAGDDQKLREIITKDITCTLVNKRDEFTMTPLHIASQRGNLKVCFGSHEHSRVLFFLFLFFLFQSSNLLSTFLMTTLSSFFLLLCFVIKFKDGEDFTGRRC